MTPPLPPASIPWQLTGNHWIALPCIHPADASIRAVGVLHRGVRSAVELAASPDFLDGGEAALLRPVLRIGGDRFALSAAPVAWERALEWIPTFTCTIGTAMVRGSIFAPYGRDADVPGAVYALSVENRGQETLELSLAMEGEFQHRQARVRTARAATEKGIVRSVGDGMVVLHDAGDQDLAALAIAGHVDADVRVHGSRFEVTHHLRVAAGAREQLAVYLAVGPERDGAVATARFLRQRGWRDLLAATRDAIQSLEQTTGADAIDRTINRNLLFAYFYAVGRGLDDAQYYLLRTRAPWHGHGVTVRDWEALMWTIPAVQLADPALARELLIRTCELHGYAPGRGVHYLEGSLFEPGFALEGLAAFTVAVDRYIRETGDDRIVDEPAIADTLYLIADELPTRRDRQVPLYATEVSPSGQPTPFPYTLHANALVAFALDVLRRTLDEETAREVEDPDAVRAAIMRHFTADRDGKPVFASSVDLAGEKVIGDDAAASVLWLPLYEAVSRQDSTYRRTVKAMAPPGDTVSLVQQCARLLGPESATVLQWLRRARLDAGLAAEFVDGEGKAVGNGGDAALSGLLAWTLWYAMHALGERA